MTYENIVLKKQDRFGDGVLRQSEVIPFLAPFIDKLALKYPHWVFTEKNTTDNETTKKSFANRFVVEDGREILGYIDYCMFNDKEGGGKQYRITNERVERLRERGYGIRTKHIDKAMKHVAKMFGKKNVSEILATAITETESAMKIGIWNKERDVNNLWGSLNIEVKKFVLENYEAFSSTVISTLIDNAVNKLPVTIAEYKSALHINEEWAVNNAFVIHIDSVNYYVKNLNEPFKVMESNELPDHMRRAVGLLKLSEDGTIIDGVGLRVDGATFLVLDKQPNIVR